MGLDYKVRIYPAAELDLLEIIEYLNTLSPQAALKYYDLLTEQIVGLSSFPERCPRPKDSALIAKGYRYLNVKDYLVFYKVIGDTAGLFTRLPGCRRVFAGGAIRAVVCVLDRCV